MKVISTIGFLVLSISMLLAQSNPSTQQPPNQASQTVTTTTTAPADQSAPQQNAPVAPANSTIPNQSTNPGVKPSDVQTTPPVTEPPVVVTPSETLPTPAPAAGASNATGSNQAGASNATMNQGNAAVQPTAPTTPQAVQQSPATMPTAAAPSAQAPATNAAPVTTETATTPRIATARAESGLAVSDSAWASPSDTESLAEASIRARRAMASDHPRVFTNADVARDRQAAGLPPQEPVANQSTMPASDVVVDQQVTAQPQGQQRRVPSPFRPKPASPDQNQPQ